MTSTEFQSLSILKIEGPPGSGKTRELAREACRLIVAEGIPQSGLLILGMTPANRRRLAYYLLQEAESAGLNQISVPLLTLEEWLLGLLSDGGPAPPQLLQDVDARVLLHNIFRENTPPGHPLHHAIRQNSASRLFFELIRQLQLKDIGPEQVLALTHPPLTEESRLPLLAQVYARFQEETRAVGMVCHADLANRALQRILRLMSGGNLPENVPIQWPSVILIDEAQELSEVHHRILVALPSRLVLAGHDQLSIRSFRGANPELFQALLLHGARPVTYVNLQACLRGNESILSLLNGFLPNPIWETQAPEREQLAQQVKFGFYADPQQEAQGIADLLADFVSSGRVAERPARWNDCVVLLRSAHYRQHLVHAFLEKGIPFRHERISEETARFQQGLYDLLNVLEHWQTLQLDAVLLLDSTALKAHLVSDLPMSLLEREYLFQQNARHLLRWLETALAEQDAAGDLRHLQTPTGSEPSDSLLLGLANRDACTTPVRNAYGWLVDLYVAYLKDGCAVALAASWLQFTGSAADIQTLDAVEGFQANLQRLQRNYQAVFGQCLPMRDILAGFQELWDASDAVTEAPLDVVRLLSIHQVQGETFPMVVIPFLVSEEFPYTREMPELLPSSVQEALGVSASSEIQEAEEARLLSVGMSRASEKLILSCHKQNEDAAVIPSPFYVKLLAQKRLLLEGAASSHICRCENAVVMNPQDCEVDFCPLISRISPQSEPLEPENELYGRYVGESSWAKLGKMVTEPLFEAEEILELSASSIKTYMQCPRQFYYRHLLRLPQPGSQAASLGTLVHRVMELFNRQAGQFPYTVERLKQLAEKLFVFQDDLESFYEAGFNEKDLREIRLLSRLTLSAMRQRLLETIDDLARKGYFDRYGTLKRVEPEKRLEGIVLEGLSGCRISGSMDAVVQLSDGTWEIVDYKTFRNAYKANWDTCERHFLQTLEPLPDDEDLTHAERFGSKLSAQYPKDYQLPLYYLACRQNPDYAERLRSVSMQIMRPAFADKPEQGSIRLEISAEEIEAKKSQMLADIQRYIVSPIRECASFAAAPTPATCGSCGYFGICEAAEDVGDETGGIE